MSDPFSDMLFDNLKANQDVYRASIEQGVLIGRREMKPLIRELVNALKDAESAHEYCGGAAINIQSLLDRAIEALDDPPHSGREASEL